MVTVKLCPQGEECICCCEIARVVDKLEEIGAPCYCWAVSYFYFRYTVLQTQNGIRYSTVFDQAGR